MSLKKDKQKVLGETFDDERIKSFLDIAPPQGVNADYHCLEVAYRGMHQENFATFVKFFVEAGRDLNSRNPQGKTISEVISEHRHGTDYLESLKAAGAQ